MDILENRIGDRPRFNENSGLSPITRPDQALNDTTLAEAGHAFKTRHANFSVEQAIERVAGMLE